MRYQKGWIVLLILALLTPLGLVAIGSAWGEWDLDTIKEHVGFMPQGMEKASGGAPRAPIPDYEFPGLTESGFKTGLGTIISALIGAGITSVAVFLIGRLMRHGRLS